METGRSVDQRKMGCKSTKTLQVYDGTKDHALVPGHEASQFTQALVHHHEAHKGGTPLGEAYIIDWHKDSLGFGMQGIVRRCTHKITKVEYALKTIRLDGLSDSEINDVMQEVNIMKQVSGNKTSIQKNFVLLMKTTNHASYPSLSCFQSWIILILCR